MELTYTEVDGYFYPDLTLPETEDHRPLGKYGLLRKTYLKRYRPMMYDRLLLAGKLDVHLRKIDALAAEQVDRVIADLAAKEGVDEQLKATDQLRWVGQMNSFKAAAEEQVLREIVYGYVIAAVAQLYKDRESIPNMRIVWGHKLPMRHFHAFLEPYPNEEKK